MLVCLYVDLLSPIHRGDAYNDVRFSFSKVTTMLLQAYFRLRGFQQVEDHRFRDNQQLKVIGLSTLRASRL